jgi:excinuclease ABC subunit C
MDIIAITSSPTSCIEHVKIRNGNIIGNQAYFPRIPSAAAVESPEEQWLAMFEAFFRFYYIDNPNAIPARILTQPILKSSSIPAYEAALKQLSQRACHIQTHARGAAKGWMDFALNNLDLHIKQHLTRLDKMGQRVEGLKQKLNLSTIERLECFDISHIQGHATIASCVVFTSLGPDKSAYRQFSIKNLKAGDDYAALDEALTRRFKRLILENQSQPDILLIDGGKGQVNVAKTILEQLGLHQIKLLGITKGDGRKACFDRIYDAQSGQYLFFAAEDEALHFLQHLRNEAHRFAITAHRKKRGREQLQSSLETIEGIGPMRKKALITYFGGLQGLKKASLLEIMKVPGISAELAKRIFEHFSVQ